MNVGAGVGVGYAKPGVGLGVGEGMGGGPVVAPGVGVASPTRIARGPSQPLASRAPPASARITTNRTTARTGDPRSDELVARRGSIRADGDARAARRGTHLVRRR